ncbi:MAG: flagellar protein FlaG [Spirochaetota bacterium]
MALDIASITSTLPHLPGEAPSHPVVAQAARLAPTPPLVDRPKPEPVIPSDLQATIKNLEKVSAAFNRHLSFSVNQKLDSIVVKVVDSETDKVIREIPPADLQHVYEAIRETIGILFDHKA